MNYMRRWRNMKYVYLYLYPVAAAAVYTLRLDTMCDPEFLSNAECQREIDRAIAREVRSYIRSDTLYGRGSFVYVNVKR